MADARVEQRHRDEAHECYELIFGYCITDAVADKQNRARFAQVLANAEQRWRIEGMERAAKIFDEEASSMRGRGATCSVDRWRRQRRATAEWAAKKIRHVTARIVAERTPEVKP